MFCFKLVWSSTTDVGCGVTRCPSVDGFTDAHFVVCYYGPPSVVFYSFYQLLYAISLPRLSADRLKAAVQR